MRRLSESIQEVFWIFDPNTNQFEYVSAAFQRLFGWSPEAYVQEPRKFMDLFLEEDFQLIKLWFEKLKSGHYIDVDHRLKHQNGTIRWVHLRASMIKDGQKELIVGVSNDITARKHEADNLERLATVDSLTGVANRRHFDNVYTAEWQRHMRFTSP